ncbi:hypothetical protein LCM27_06535 [Ruegeria marisrubri]|uniref:hypothetical protein n=1 Tax=Ruegeria marisrubri TaxID=1685379 RepID=UPI001CD40D02|nr:hypothetical protein [Ruegeria marisrubri]MCA0906051.1 hypothetical protein [Ruegeria marisrubri]
MPAQAILSLTILFGGALIWILATKPVGVPALGWFLGRHAATLGAAMILLALKPRNLDTSDDAPGAAVST